MSSLSTAAEIADLLRVSVETVREWARQRRIPSIKLSAKAVRFNAADVLAAIKARQEAEGGSDV
jgi:excisionase family DNA binding protein